MSKHKLERYNPEYPYKNDPVVIQKKGLEFPIPEHTNNARIFPEGINDFIDLKQFKPGH
jgi:hypothetical protein